MFIRPTVFRVLHVLCSVMFIAEVVTSVSVSSPGDDSSNSSSSSSIIRSTLLDDIALESRYVDDEWFYQLAKYGSNLERELSTDNGPFTLFLPSAEALSDLEDNTFPRSCLYTDCDYYNGDQCDEFVSTDLLTSILLYHIVQGEAILPSDLVDGQIISTMNGENVTIGVNGTFEIDFVNGTIAIDGLPVKSAMPFPTVRGNILYYLDTALLPRSIADQKSEIIATCEVPYTTQYCQGVRNRFDDFVGEQQCASCGGYFQETENFCSSSSNSRTCIPECQWFNDYCTEECCWDTHDQQLELTTPFDRDNSCEPPPCSHSGIWTVAPCDPGVTIKAGWHETKESGTFQMSRTKDCDIQKFAKPNSVTPVWHVDCTDLYYDFKYFHQCGPIDMTVAIWMEDSDGKFLGYYLDPLVENNIMAGNDSCMIEESIRILLAWLIPSIVLTLIGCCYYFCCWRRKKDPDDPSSLQAANREDSKETDANNNNNAVNHANLEDKREVDEPETLSAEAIPPSS